MRDAFTSGSDVDVPVEFEAGKISGCAFISMEKELPGILGCRVDLNTSSSLSKYFRDEVLAEAEPAFDFDGKWANLDRIVEAEE